jgi:Uma2 family endonuclease
MSHPTRAVSAEELFKYPDSRAYELVRGVPRVSEPPGGAHGRIAGRITVRLGAHVERLGLGTVLVEAGYLLRRAPDTVRGPDVSFVSAARLSPERVPEQFIPGAPDLAIEILSPSSRWSDVEEVIADYFTAGARLVWLVDPGERRVVVRYADRPPKIVAAGDILDGEEVVPGFALAAGELFGPVS